MASIRRPAWRVDARLQVTGLGDLLVEGKYKLYDNNGLRLAGIAGLTLPTSFGSDGTSSSSATTCRPRAAARRRDVHARPRLALGADAGIILRKPRTIYASTIGQQLDVRRRRARSRSPTSSR